MSKDCEEKLQVYISEIETKNQCKIDPREIQQVRNIFNAGYSAALEAILSKQKANE